MTEISKGTLISEIDSIIAGLNLSTAETEVLSLIYKTAINAGADASAIAGELTSRIEAASSNSDITELLTFSVIADIITSNREISVANLTELNSLTDVGVGSVYYVESLEVPYIRVSTGWIPVEFNSQPGEPLVIGLAAYSWGNNTNGRLGDNSTVEKSSPVSVVGGFTDWVQVSAGDSHNLGVRANGTAWAWGSNGQGQLGDVVVLLSVVSPISVVGGFTDWTQVSAGGRYFSLGVRSNGTAWGWGLNQGGVLGDNTVVSKRSPVLVVGGFTDWVQVSAGYAHSLGLRANGTAWAWGYGGGGQLGNNAAANRSSPVSVVGGFTDWVQVSAGRFHNLGVRANGTAWAWGFGSHGSLGDNSTVPKSSPVSVVGGFTDWTQVSAGSFHGLGLRANGTAWAWGLNSSGHLGDNTTVDKSSPVSVVGGFTDWVQVNAGRDHSLGVRANGTAWAWGSNTNGQLGDNTTVDKSSPVSVVGGFTNWVQVSGGRLHSLGFVTAIG